jgi:hypothetical protein
MMDPVFVKLNRQVPALHSVRVRNAGNERT